MTAAPRTSRRSRALCVPPQLDVQGAFQAFIGKALGQTYTGGVFNPYAHDQLLLLGAFILEDVMVTAYQVDRCLPGACALHIRSWMTCTP